MVGITEISLFYQYSHFSDSLKYTGYLPSFFFSVEVPGWRIKTTTRYFNMEGTEVSCFEHFIYGRCILQSCHVQVSLTSNNNIIYWRHDSEKHIRSLWAKLWCSSWKITYFTLILSNSLLQPLLLLSTCDPPPCSSWYEDNIQTIMPESLDVDHHSFCKL